MSAVVEQPSASLETRLVLTQVERYILVFPALWVAEIARFKHSQILEMPFYQAPMLGLMHQNGQVISLVSAAQLLQVKQPVTCEIATVVRLGEAAGTLSQVGVVVDKVIGGTTCDQVPDDLFHKTSAEPGEMILLRQEWFSKEVWLPQQWMA